MSQTQDILVHLKKQPITPIDALNLYGCFRLAARIADLKERGHSIVTEDVKENGKRFARYRLLSS